jgi:hypothetical protein
MNIPDINSGLGKDGIQFKEVPGALEIGSIEQPPYYWLRGGSPLGDKLEVYFQSVKVDLEQIGSPGSIISIPVPYMFSDYAFSHCEKVEIQGDLGKRLCIHRLVYACGINNDENISLLLRVEDYTARNNTGGPAWAEIDFQRCENSLILGAEEESRGLVNPNTLLGVQRRGSSVRVINYNTSEGNGEQFQSTGVISLQNLFDNPPGGKVIVAFDFPDPPVIKEGKKYRRTVGETAMASIMEVIYGKFGESFDLAFRENPLNTGKSMAGGYRFTDASNQPLSSNSLLPPGMEITITK